MSVVPTINARFKNRIPCSSCSKLIWSPNIVQRYTLKFYSKYLTSQLRRRRNIQSSEGHVNITRTHQCEHNRKSNTPGQSYEQVESRHGSCQASYFRRFSNPRVNNMIYSWEYIIDIMCKESHEFKNQVKVKHSITVPGTLFSLEEIAKLPHQILIRL